MEHRELAILHLAGSEAAMGRQHATLVRDLGRYQGVVDFYPQMPERFLTQGVRGGRAMIRRAITGLSRWAVARLHRDRPAPSRARADAFYGTLGRPELARSMFVMDFLQNAVGLAGRYGLLRELPAIPRALAACSSLVAWGGATVDGSVRHGRNFDFPGQGVWDHEPVVVFCAPSGALRYGFLATRGADVPGVTGFNEAGLGVNLQTRFSRHVRFSGLGAVDLGHEMLRRARTLEEAVAVARERPIASSWGITVSSAAERRAVVIECHARRVAVVEPEPGAELLVQTNRYLHPDLQEGEIAATPSLVAHSDFRHQGLVRETRARLAAGPLCSRAVGELLASHRDPDAPDTTRAVGGCLDQPDTVQRVVFDLAGGEILVSIARCGDPGPLWTRVPVTWETPPGARVERVAARLTETAAAEAYHRYVATCRLGVEDASDETLAEGLAQVLALAPEDPSYLAAAAGIAMRQGAWDAALLGFERSFDFDRSPYRQGQWRLWASRAAAAAGQSGRARAHRQAVLATAHPYLAPERAEAARDGAGSRALKRPREVRVNLETLDLQSLA